MEKAVLTSYEEKCIQEEPAFCTAGCPFHMDVKAFLGHMAKQEADKAFKIIEKTLPLPDILARICDHPCENRCIRKDIDASLAIGGLERICAASRSKQKKRFSASPKGKKVGIWGSGLSSLTAAWDLGLKGYEVIVYDQAHALGGNLLQLSREVLPKKILEQEILSLQNHGVCFRTAASPDEAFGGQKIQTFDAVYLGFDSPGDAFFGIAYDETGRPRTDDFTLGTIEPKVFAGGFSSIGERLNPRSYPIADAAQGRKAATSIDRVLSGVSLSAGREREGSCSTRLSTDISGIKPETRLKLDIGSGIDLAKAGREALRCIQCDCSRCIRVCTYIDSFKGFPGRYAREIYNNASIVMGERKSNLLVNSCCLCTLCETVCPHDFSMTGLCLAARREMVEKGKMPPSAHAFALQEMAFGSGEECFFARHEPGQDQSTQIFFPGCQLTGSAPSQVQKVYEFLRTQLSGSTGFVSGCCGAPAHWAGRESLFEKNIEPFKAFWEASGRPLIITACTSCTQMLAKALNQARIRSVFQQMAQMTDLLADNFSAAARELQGRLSVPVNISDPCTARNDAEVREAVRTLAGSAGLTVKELPASGPLTECCGFGGLVFNANPVLSKDMIRQRAGQSENDFLAYCAMCRDRLASTGKKAVHVLDLFWPETDRPEQRKDPGFSRRHENLALVKKQMLEQIWNEKDTGKPVPLKMQISISPEVEQVLEDQYILLTDIEKVLDHFETGAAHFFHCETGIIIAFYRPVNVCFWVEFKKNNGGYEILDAWHHRMNVAANDRFVPDAAAEVHDPAILCRSCNQALTPFKNQVEYLGSRFDVALPQCRQCGMIFISPALARGKMAEVEKILEDK